MESRFDIWDLHCHLSGVPGNTPEARLGKLLEYADRMDIARLCVFMGMEWSYDPSPEKMRQEMDSYFKERFMPRYSDLLKQYYSNIAEQNKKK